MKNFKIFNFLKQAKDESLENYIKRLEQITLNSRRQTRTEKIKATERNLYMIKLNCGKYNIDETIGYLIKNKVKVNYKGR